MQNYHFCRQSFEDKKLCVYAEVTRREDAYLLGSIDGDAETLSIIEDIEHPVGHGAWFEDKREQESGDLELRRPDPASLHQLEGPTEAELDYCKSNGLRVVSTTKDTMAVVQIGDRGAKFAGDTVQEALNFASAAAQQVVSQQQARPNKSSVSAQLEVENGSASLREVLQGFESVNFDTYIDLHNHVNTQLAPFGAQIISDPQLEDSIYCDPIVCLKDANGKTFEKSVTKQDEASKIDALRKALNSFLTSLNNGQWSTGSYAGPTSTPDKQTEAFTPRSAAAAQKNIDAIERQREEGKRIVQESVKVGNAARKAKVRIKAETDRRKQVRQKALTTEDINSIIRSHGITPQQFQDVQARDAREKAMLG